MTKKVVLTFQHPLVIFIPNGYAGLADRAIVKSHTGTERHGPVEGELKDAIWKMRSVHQLNATWQVYSDGSIDVITQPPKESD